MCFWDSVLDRLLTMHNGVAVVVLIAAAHCAQSYIQSGKCPSVWVQYVLWLADRRGVLVAWSGFHKISKSFEAILNCYILLVQIIPLHTDTHAHVCKQCSHHQVRRFLEHGSGPRTLYPLIINRWIFIYYFLGDLTSTCNSYCTHCDQVLCYAAVERLTNFTCSNHSIQPINASLYPHGVLKLNGHCAAGIITVPENSWIKISLVEVGSELSAHHISDASDDRTHVYHLTTKQELVGNLTIATEFSQTLTSSNLKKLGFIKFTNTTESISADFSTDTSENGSLDLMYRG